ncbi:hypothetical protein MJO28_006002 [Puccinia striiformis f. sp. tritici]|uniref:Uncharacterized protein n=1 Tax=Puccinia striiformis f. sp. tritici TaxID=168172 RepID=A0ACC0EG72_9BASI|nr:hypothetical protein MJO28_006002 [Puccinia striiformis f. sp. tritici]
MVSSKLERLTLCAINGAAQPKQSTLTPDHSRNLDRQETIAYSPLGFSNHLQHISVYQKPNQNRLVAHQRMKMMIVEDDPIKFVLILLSFNCFR